MSARTFPHFHVADAGWRWWPLHATTPAPSPSMELHDVHARMFDR